MTVHLSLRTKLALLMAGVIALLSLIVFVHLNDRIRADAMSAAHDEGIRIAELASFAVSAALLFEDRQSASEALNAVCRSSVVSSIEVRDARGNRFAGCNGSSTSLGVLVSTVPVTSGSSVIGSLRLALSLETVTGQIATSRKWLAGVTLLIFGLGMAAAVGISLFVTRPLQSITETAEAIRAGDSTRRAVATSDDEVGTLAKTFNLMLDEQEVNRDELTRLNHDLEQTVELRTREMTTLLQSTYDGIMAADANGRCVMMNRSAAAALGMDAVRGIGHDLHELLHGQCPRADCSLPSLLSGGDRRQVRESFNKADGSPISVDVSVAPMQDGERTTGTVMTFRDVTELDHLQAQLDQALRVYSLGTLAANMAHEFNNVLMGILPFVDMIRRTPSSEPRLEQWCRTIIQSVNRGKRVTQEVLRFTRPLPLNLRTLNMKAWLLEFAPALRSVGSGAAIEVISPSGDLNVPVDREQLEQVLINLVSNSGEAMSGGGRVQISVSVESGFALLSVGDDGPGMSADTLSRVFEPFFSTKRLGGTGLGIPIAEQIVTAHGGSLGVKSAPGEGTVFEIRIPMTSAEGALDAPAELVTGAFRGRVLLVEDDAAVAAGLQAILEDEGVEVNIAATGQAAVVALSDVLPDVMILDIGLPDIDGVELYRLISDSHPDLPVIFSTGHGDESKIQDILQLPNVRFMLKPYSAEALLEALAEIAVPSAPALITSGDAGFAVDS